ncbi:transglycosylase SLT domain-containing protein [Aliidiomarina soli]|uniref:Murein transglycosylase n=1 Tax=Aliidiomarina soli TaxID=1928574 RepID=A0A432WIT9_9GAMM|nr:transglycosylase SLT domain-containing protein [Aliidiomarina soli]RUO33678.1 hypothetical protein CWE14_04225 [Aliidiomarina soli]
MEQKCGTNHPTLQPGFKQVFKSFRWLALSGCLAFISSLPVWSGEVEQHRPTQADARPLPENLSELRSEFVEAERSAGRADAQEFFELTERFYHYPLWPYIEAAYLEANLSLGRESRIRNFMQLYYGTAAERSLRDSWLRYLARRNDKQRFVRDFVDRGSQEQMCRYLVYRLQLTNEPTEALWQMVEQRWVQPQSQPRTCDPAFNAWQQAGQRTDAVVWERFDLAIDAENWSMARYLRSLLTNEQSIELADNILLLRQRPQRIIEYHQLPGDSERAKAHVIATTLKLAWRDIGVVRKVWEGMQAHFSFSDEQRQKVNSLVGVVLAVREEKDAREWFEQLPLEGLSESARHWYLATLLRQQDFAAILSLAESLPDSSTQYRYWQARALNELGRPLEAEPIWHELAEQRHYYGFMAAAQLDVAPNLHRESVIIDEATRSRLLSRPEVQRAYEFLQLERYLDARREWNLVRARLPDEEREVAAVLASQWQWLDQSIREFSNLGLYSDLERRFPLGYQQLLTQHSGHWGLDLAWVYAIIRRESAFQPDARSPVGARGLMQIMPTTADYIERNTPGPTNRHPPRLDRPEDNIRLGTRYMADLLSRNRGNWLLATASYNAGYRRVQQWVPEAQVAADIWIETIPYQETRDYVKAVLTYQQIYANLLGQDDKLMQHMHSMLIHPDGGICTNVESPAQLTSLC